jgi:hypothetical protein
VRLFKNGVRNLSKEKRRSCSNTGKVTKTRGIKSAENWIWFSWYGEMQITREVILHYRLIGNVGIRRDPIRNRLKDMSFDQRGRGNVKQ